MKPAGAGAVMASRQDARDELDDFPTHPWATRAVIEHVIGADVVRLATVAEPAANRGFMARPLEGYAKKVWASDVFDYGAGYPVFDFLSLRRGSFGVRAPWGDELPQWIFTNPPFKDLEKWIEIALAIAREGVAFFVRTQVLEGVDRHAHLFGALDPRCWTFAQFAERVPLHKGRLLDPDKLHPFEDPKTGAIVMKRPSTATAYGWLVIWKLPEEPLSLLKRRHIPPCRVKLTRPGDYR